MGDLTGSRWADLCSARSQLPPFCLSLLYTITHLFLSPSAAVHFPLFSSSCLLSSGLAAMRSSEIFQLNKREMTVYPDQRNCDMQECFNAFIPPIPGLQLWSIHYQDVELNQKQYRREGGGGGIFFFWKLSKTSYKTAEMCKSWILHLLNFQHFHSSLRQSSSKLFWSPSQKYFVYYLWFERDLLYVLYSGTKVEQNRQGEGSPIAEWPLLFRAKW